MTDKERVEKFYIDVDSLGLKFPGATISKATGYKKGTVSSYLNKKLDPSAAFMDAFYDKFQISLNNVPVVKPEVPADGLPINGENGHNRTDQLLEMMMQLLKAQNKILERQETELVTNLKEVLGGVTSIALNQQADRQVMLASLSRLEHLPEKKLLRDADKIKDEKIRSLGARGKKPA